jgi:hypothetical protein
VDGLGCVFYATLRLRLYCTHVRRVRGVGVWLLVCWWQVAGRSVERSGRCLCGILGITSQSAVGRFYYGLWGGSVMCPCPGVGKTANGGGCGSRKPPFGLGIFRTQLTQVTDRQLQPARLTAQPFTFYCILFRRPLEPYSKASGLMPIA